MNQDCTIDYQPFDRLGYVHSVLKTKEKKGCWFPRQQTVAAVGKVK